MEYEETDDEVDEIARTSLIYQDLQRLEELICINRELMRTYMKLKKCQNQPAYKRKNQRIKNRLSGLDARYNRLESEYSIRSDEYEHLKDGLRSLSDYNERRRLVFMWNMEFVSDLQ